MMIKLKIVFIAVISIVSSQSFSQQLGPRITESMVSLYNNSDRETSILLGDTAVRLDTFFIKAQEVWHSPSYVRDPVIKIQTGSFVATYLLRRGNSFMIYWNGRKKYWDLKRIQKR